MNIDNFIRQIKTKLDKAKIDLLKEKNELSKLSSKLVEFDNNLANLNLDNIQEILILLESTEEVIKDIQFLNSYKVLISFLKNPQIENEGVKKNLLDEYSSLKEKFKVKKTELIAKQKLSIEKLQDSILDYTKLKNYLENLDGDYSLEEIDEFMDLCELIDMNLTDRLELITYIGKITLKAFKKHKIEDSIITKENIEDIIKQTTKNEKKVEKTLEVEDDKVLEILTEEEIKAKKEEDRKFKEKELILKELRKTIEEILKEHNDMLTYYYDLNAGKDMSKSPISAKDYAMSSGIIPYLLDLKKIFEDSYDSDTIDDCIGLSNISLKEYREYLEVVPKKEEEKSNDSDTSLDDFTKKSANIILFSKSNDEYQVDLNLRRDDEDKKALKENELIKAVRCFANSTYIDVIRVGSNIDLLHKDVKNKYRKNYDNATRAFRLRASDNCRTCYVVVDTCEENMKKIKELYGNSNVTGSGRVILIFSVIWVDAKHNDGYDEANDDLKDNLDYINKINKLFKDPNTKKETLKEIIDESMTKSLSILNKENSLQR